MRRFARKFHHLTRTFLACALGLQLLLICAAAASPALHEWMHPDADGAGHECAITLFATGACDASAPPLVATAPYFLPVLDKLAADQPALASSFRFSGVLEHAPPASA